MKTAALSIVRQPLRSTAWALLLGCLLPLSACQQQDSATQQTVADSQAASSSNTTTPDAAGPTTPYKLEDVALSAQELEDGWVSLFDGETLFGWTNEDKADWRVENSVIVAEQGENSLLVTTSQFSDYQLKLQFRCEKSTNSGVFLSTVVVPEDVTKDCYELNIAGPDNPFPTGSLVQRQAVEGDLQRAGWQAYDVTVQQGHIVVRLDGQQVLDYTDSNPIPRGHIGLQMNSGRIEFRGLKLKPLGTQSIFDGATLAGWKSYPDMPSKFTVDAAQQTLNVVDGRGQLETETQYGDFVLQLECITHAEHLNSGIFFRCIPGEQMNGYECQIQNQCDDDDPTKPTDCGTGGIFRRQNARRIVAEDLEWFTMTLIADGPHMASWVNGIQVSDWTDTRTPDPNPRKGLRLEPGTIMIQGHDPTTNLSFRRLRIAPLR